MTTDEETLEQLRLEQKTLEESILSARKRIAEIREITTLLSPKVEAAKRKREWIAGEPEREKLRATPEFQEWKKDFFEKEEQRAKDNIRLATPVVEEVENLTEDNLYIFFFGRNEIDKGHVFLSGQELLVKLESRFYPLSMKEIQPVKIWKILHLGLHSYWKTTPEGILEKAGVKLARIRKEYEPTYSAKIKKACVGARIVIPETPEECFNYESPIIEDRYLICICKPEKLALDDLLHGR